MYRLEHKIIIKQKQQKMTAMFNISNQPNIHTSLWTVIPMILAGGRTFKNDYRAEQNITNNREDIR